MPILPPARKYIEMAEEMRQKLDSGEAKHQGELADLYQVSRPRVVQILGLLRLTPEILSYVKTMAPGPEAGSVTEKQLRGVLRYDHPTQKQLALSRLPGFAFSISGNQLPSSL